jgi:hypothetical protein
MWTLPIVLNDDTAARFRTHVLHLKRKFVHQNVQTTYLRTNWKSVVITSSPETVISVAIHRSTYSPYCFAALKTSIALQWLEIQLILH